MPDYLVRGSNPFGSIDSVTATIDSAPSDFTLDTKLDETILRDPHSITSIPLGNPANSESFTLVVLQISGSTRLGEVVRQIFPAAEV